MSLGQMIRAWKLWKRFKKEMEAGKMNVGDKAALKSATIWGTLIKTAGKVALLAGAVVAGEKAAGMQDFLALINPGEIIGALGWVLGEVIEKFGHRKAQGKLIKAVEQAQTGAVPVVVDVQPSQPVPTVEVSPRLQ